MSFIVITDFKTCPVDVETYIKGVCQMQPDEIILREKTLDVTAYCALAEQLLSNCKRSGIPLRLHTHLSLLDKLALRRVHMSYGHFVDNIGQRPHCDISVSVHSVEEARFAYENGAHQLIAGHILKTRSKPGLPPRGFEFLNAVSKAVPIPVYGIGGLNLNHIKSAHSVGAKGICMLSGVYPYL